MIPFGREKDLERVDGALGRAASGAGSIVLVTGEAGIGKSTLAREAARRATELGFEVAWGRCWEAGGAPPYWPWIQVFRAIERDPFRDVPLEAQHPREQRFRLFDTAARELVAAAKERPLAIVLDDLHAADLAALLLLLFVARHVANAPILAIGTARDAEARSAPEVREALAAIAREGEHLSLARLGREDVARWVAGDADVDEIFRVTEGNPFFVKELLRVGARRASDGINVALDDHLGLVPDEARSLLAVASVLGREVQASEVAALAALDVDTTRDRLRAACAAGVLEELEGARFQFTHVLLRDRLYETLASRSALEWRAGLVLEEAGASPAVVAHHLLEGASAGDVETAARATLRAIARADAELAFEASASLAERALALFGAAPSKLACELEIALGAALARSGSVDEGHARCVRAADQARALGAADALARAALTYGQEMIAAAVDPTMVRLLEDARAALGPGESALGAKVTARLAAALVPARSAEEAARAIELAREGVAIARRVGDDETLLTSLVFARAALIPLVHVDETFELTRELVDLARARREHLVSMIIGPKYATALLEKGRRAEADAALAEIVELDKRLRYPMTGWRVPMARAVFAMFDGHLDEAERLGDEGLAMAKSAGSRQADLVWAQQRMASAIARDEPAHITRDGDRLLGILSQTGPLTPMRAWALAALGRKEEARRSLTEDLGHGPLYSLLFAGDACALLQDRDAARVLDELIRARWRGTHFFWGGLTAAFVMGPTARVLAGLARLLGDYDEARRLYEEAIELCARIGATALLELSRKRLKSLDEETGARPRSSPPRKSVPLALEREGDVWAVRSTDGSRFRVKHSKGLVYLSTLVENPGRELHVLALMGLEHAAGDAGPVLDERAREAYKTRLESLEDEVAEAESFGDVERARRAREEIEALARQLAGAVGLSGRGRRAASDVEKARINVQRCIKDALDRIGKSDPALGRYLAATVITGTHCSFRPL